MKLRSVALLVREYDEAIAFYTSRLGFRLIEDADLGHGKRWVLVVPEGLTGTQLLLARAVTSEQLAQVGKQAGGRVFLFFHTDDFRRDYAAMKSRGVTFLEQPREEPYGTVAVFEDLYGNRFDLIQPKKH
jgi:catechol 2,3-dioxygenase-like lactoylglutathione lyase family enzyme